MLTEASLTGTLVCHTLDLCCASGTAPTLWEKLLLAVQVHFQNVMNEVAGVFLLPCFLNKTLEPLERRLLSSTNQHLSHCGQKGRGE